MIMSKIQGSNKFIIIIIIIRRAIVKPWSKSLSQQAPKLNKSPPKKEKNEGFGPWAETIIEWATHPTTPPHPTNNF